MKSYFVLPRFAAHAIAVLAAVMIAGLLAGCGQKGPLYLPGKPSAVSNAPQATPAGATGASSPLPVSK